MVDNTGSLRPGSERNRKFAEELERKAGLGTSILQLQSDPYLFF